MRRLEQVGCQQRLPETDEEAAKVEELLAEELSNLSMSEQDVVSFEVHGIVAEVEETPELIAQSLIEMEAELQKIKKKPAYEKALKMNPTYVTGQSFRLQFLRCVAFNCKNAARRLVLHFRQKEEMFGCGDVLVRDVRLSDMDVSDIEAMEAGPIQLLPTCDVSGRAVLCFLLKKWSDKPKAKTAQRVLYYMMQAAMQDENMQRKGIVAILYYVGSNYEEGTFGFNITKSVFQTRLCVPHRLEAMHLCYSSKAFRPILSGLRFFMDRRGRTRSRIHFGNEKHLLFQLQTYGIPIPDDSPLRQVNGAFSSASHREWLQIREALEMKVAGTDEMPKTLFPHRFDVLFGRSTKVRSHTGNLRAVHLVNMWQTRYDEAPNRARKAEISERIVSIIQESNGRFLKWEETGWVEVADEEARDKIAHYFRNQRRTKTDNNTNKQSTALKRNRSLTEIAV
mmetsp:Transcript_17559/g.43207  ORF Transcript_17559/g.43207 Transcript_17559/m.43207 type:complete len:452 (+) Transcript_17559:1565-2920(+)